jgi:hypothetical protein
MRELCRSAFSRRSVQGFDWSLKGGKLAATWQAQFHWRIGRCSGGYFVPLGHAHWPLRLAKVMV